MFGEADDEGHARIGRFDNRIGRKTGGHIDDGTVGAFFFHCFAHRIEDGHVVFTVAALAGGHTSHDVGAILNHLLGVEGAFFASDALHHQPGIFVDENTHGGF